MGREAEHKITDRELTRAVGKAFDSVLKMIRAEPHPIIISDSDGDNSEDTINEITAWLFHRRQTDVSERDPDRN